MTREFYLPESWTVARCLAFAQCLPCEPGYVVWLRGERIAFGFIGSFSQRKTSE